MKNDKNLTRAQRIALHKCYPKLNTRNWYYITTKEGVTLIRNKDTGKVKSVRLGGL